MALLSDAVTERLLANATLTALIGSGANARFNWVRRNQGDDRPALVAAQVGGTPDDLDLAGDVDFSESRIQLRAVGDSYRETRAVLKAASDALMGVFTAGGINFWEGERERPIDLGGEAAGGTFLHEATQDVILRHAPAA